MRQLILIGAFALAACHADPTAVEGGLLVKDTWGGADAGVIISETQTHVHIGCTYGDFPASVPVNEQGRFSVNGSYLLRAYPVAIGPALPAEFAGTVNGSSITYTIVVNDTVENKFVTLGPATVTLGKEPRMGPCPICHAPTTRLGR